MLVIVIAVVAVALLSRRTDGASSGTSATADKQNDASGGALAPAGGSIDASAIAKTGVGLIGSAGGVVGAIKAAYGSYTGGVAVAETTGGTAVGTSTAVEGTALATVSMAAVVNVLAIAAFAVAVLAFLVFITLFPTLQSIAIKKAEFLAQGYRGLFPWMKEMIRQHEETYLEGMIDRLGGHFTRSGGVDGENYFIDSVSGIPAEQLKTISIIARVMACHEITGINHTLAAYYRNEYFYSDEDLGRNVVALTDTQMSDLISEYYAARTDLAYGVKMYTAVMSRQTVVGTNYETYATHYAAVAQAMPLRVKQAYFAGKVGGYPLARGEVQRLTVYDGQWGTPHTDLNYANAQTPPGDPRVAALNRVIEFGARQFGSILIDEQARMGWAVFGVNNTYIFDYSNGALPS